MINRKGIGSYLSVLLVARALLAGPITESWQAPRRKLREPWMEPPSK